MSQTSTTTATGAACEHAGVPQKRGTGRVRTRLGLGAAALSALVLSACGGGEAEADFSDESAAAEVVGEQLEPGFLHEDISQNVTVTDTLRPERSEVITPTGTLTVNEVQAVSTVPAEEIELEAATDEETGEQLDYIAAPGEELRVVNLTFTPHGDQEMLFAGEHESGTTSELSISAGGAQNHLQPLGSQEDRRILVSAPEDGATQFVVSSEGHDQYVDVLTGERQEDEVAAAYYRPVTTQEPHHTFPVEDSSFTVMRDGAEYEDTVISYDLQVASASLTAWVEEGGWAAPGEAWLAVDWTYDVTDDDKGVSVEELNADMSMDVDGTVTEDSVNAQTRSDMSGEATTYAAVPIGTTEAAVSLSGDITAEYTWGGTAYSLPENTAEFSTEELAISFPLEGDGGETGGAGETAGGAETGGAVPEDSAGADAGDTSAPAGTDPDAG